MNGGRSTGRNRPLSTGVEYNVRMFWPVKWLGIALAIQPHAHGSVVRPEFSAYQIGPASGGGGGWLWPGQVFSIYGKNLGPEQSCVRDAGSYRAQAPNSPEEYARVQQILPRELCSVEVLIDEEAVPLIYVHERQINFLVPRSGLAGNKVTLRVVHDRVSSIPVWLKFGADRIGISQMEPAYTGMPVWVRLYNVSANHPVELMFGLPRIWRSAECPHLEVMYNGSPLPELKAKNPLRQIVYSGPPCPSLPPPDRQSLAGRIPLHLRYRFDRPGSYLVRYVPGPDFFKREPTISESEWTPIAVKAGSEEQRRKWLRAQAAAAPCDHEGLIYDFLPSIFGYSDTAALRIALKYLYHRDAWVAGAAAGYLRDYYAASELVPALREIEKQIGANRNVDGLLRDLGVKPTTR